MIAASLRSRTDSEPNRFRTLRKDGSTFDRKLCWKGDFACAECWQALADQAGQKVLEKAVSKTNSASQTPLWLFALLESD